MRIVGLILALAGLALIVPALTLAPDTGWMSGRGSGTQLLAAAGPPVVHHDAQNDTTVLVFICSHWPCDQGATFEGDQTTLASEPHHYVRATSEDAWRVITLDPPIQPPHSMAVSEAYAGPFERVPMWPRAAAPLLAPGLLLVGLALVAAPRLRVPTAAAAAGPALGGTLASLGLVGDQSLIIIGGQLLSFLLVLVGILLVVVSPRTRAVGLALGLGASAFLVTMWLSFPYFPGLSGP